MARDTAGKWIIGVLVYFILFSVILTGISAINSAALTSSSLDTSGVDYDLSGGYNGRCDSPRDGLWSNDVNCLRLEVDSTECAYIEGCNWVGNTTEQFLWWSYTVNAYCNGTVNATYYGWSGSGTLNVCKLSGLDSDSSACSYLGCAWSDTLASETSYADVSSNPVTLWSTLKQVFTFTYDFGTGNDGVDGFLLTIFIILPYIILGIAGVMFILG